MSIDIVEPILFGAVQGLSEFLPISSSGHLSLLHRITNYSVGSDLSFDVALHLGTLVALLIFFRSDVMTLLKAWVGSFRRRRIDPDPHQRLAWWLIISAVPGALAGAILESKAETVFRAPVLTAIVLILAGILLWVADRWSAERVTIEQITWRQALWIGVGQALAIVPGVSRSGATITLGRFFGLTRDTAARFSFLMSIPIIAGAVLKQGIELRHQSLTAHQGMDFLLGAVSAAIVGYYVIKVFLRYISRHSYAVFAWYRLILGVAVLVALWIFR